MIKSLAAYGLLLGFQVAAPGRPPDIAFATRMIDPGASETAAVADINRDGRLDIVSGEYWYAAPAWTKHKFREVGFSSNYMDTFSVLPVDVDADGYVDIADVSWFAQKIAWWRNPGRQQTAALWTEASINTGGPVEFAMLADIDNDGKVSEIIAQQNGTPQAWFEVKNGGWVKHVVSDRTYDHGIGYGDVNKDGRNDILTPRGWLEAPADPRAEGLWTFHAGFAAANVPVVTAGAGRAQGAASPAAASPTAPQPVEELGFMHVVDVNADGRPDIVTAAGHHFGVFWFEQGENDQWTRRTIDNAWSQGHASTLVDLSGDGKPDFVTGKRFMAHNGSDPGEHEPLGLYWYEFRPTPARGGGAAGAGRGRGGPGAEWIRHLIDYGGRVGAGMQMPVVDVDRDGDLDIVVGGKSGLFYLENRTKSATR